MPKRLREREPARPRSPVLAPLSAIAARKLLDEEEGTATKVLRVRDREGGGGGLEFDPEPEPESEPEPEPVSAATRAAAVATGMAAGAGFVPNAGNYIVHEDGRTVSIRFTAGERIAILGEYAVEVTEGMVSICGARLTAASGVQTVYAPSTHSVPEIECIGEKGGRVREAGFDAEVVVRERNSGIRGIGGIFPAFKGIWAPPGGGGGGTAGPSFHPLLSPITIPVLAIPPPWERALQDLCRPSNTPRVILLMGSKSTGKSTFSRLLTNQLLTTTEARVVHYLDLDPGQPSFSPPGFISLHAISSPLLGPPFTTPNPRTTIQSHHTGYTSPKDDPTHYMHCTFALLSLHRRHHHFQAQAPSTLIINTAGWTKGLGRELLQEILQHSLTTDVVSISLMATAAAAGTADDIVPTDSTRVHSLASVTLPQEQGRQSFSPAELRSLQVSSYLHYSPRSQSWDFTPLAAKPPWVVGYRDNPAGKGVHAVVILGEELAAEEEVVAAIDGTLVGVVVVENDDEVAANALLLASEDCSPLPYSSSPPEPDRSYAVGMALVRGIDVRRGLFLLLSGVPTEEMQRWEGKTVLLVRGRLEVPIWELVAGVEGVVPWVNSSDAVVGKGSAVWRVRRNVMRRGQLVRD